MIMPILIIVEFGNGYLMQGEYKVMKVRKGIFGDGEWHLNSVVAFQK